jgi:SAM-dependent methyltransferase
MALPITVTPQPSAWVQRFVHLLRPGGSVLDVACGSGRHLRWLAAQGFAVTGVDRDEAAMAPLRGLAEIIVADLEGAAENRPDAAVRPSPWPLAQRQFDAVLVTNYLWRPLWPHLLGALAPNAVFVYETFANGQQHIGKPSRPEFLLNSGELLQVCAGLRVVAFEDGFDDAGGRYVQRIVAVRPGSAAAAAAGTPSPSVTPPRYGLAGPAS